MNKNKGDAGNIAGFINLENELTMNTIPQNKPQFQFNSRRELLEQTRLSKLPKLPRRAPFRLPDFDNEPTKPVAVVAVCAGCGARLDLEDAIQRKFSGCRKCISVYGRLEAVCEENEKRDRRETLAKFVAEVK